MKLQLISDLHSEFWDNPNRLYTEHIHIVPELDFLVIAGDLVVPDRQPDAYIDQAFQHFSKLARHVLYVDGNHEYYGGRPTAEIEARIRKALPENTHWLMNEDITLDGVHFYGGAMWFSPNDGLNNFYKNVMNDFKLIHNLDHWVYERNRAFTLLGQALIRPETIVVTHHLPHMNSVPEEFKREQTNRFFVSDQTALIAEKQPRLWFHGHTHRPCDYTLGTTRVLCNPFGYPNETYKLYGEKIPYPQVVLDI